MTVYVFMQGLVRPSPSKVIEVIRSIKNALNGECKVWYSTWETTEPLDEIRNEVDRLILSPEPSLSHITRYFPSVTMFERTGESVSRPDTYRWLKSLTYGCFYVRWALMKLFELGECSDTDTVIRIRSDTRLDFEPAYLQELVKITDKYHVFPADGRGVVFDDCFGISSYANMKKVWTYTSFEQYEQNVSEAMNGEDLCKRAVERNQIPVQFLDPKRVRFYVHRPGVDGDQPSV
jgi:hypothetical protein